MLIWGVLLKKETEKKAVVAGKARPAARQSAKPKEKKRALTADSLTSQAEQLFGAVNAVRQQIFGNEQAIRARVKQKVALEDAFTLLLKKNFEEEKRFLSRIRGDAARKQAHLKEKILSLERVTKIYEEKQAKIKEAEKRKSALKRELEKLNKMRASWDAYA